MKFKTIAIAGLGLMGASLAARLRKIFPRTRILGISRSSKALLAAKRKGWIHEGVRNLAKGAASSDLVVLCTPVDVIPKTLKLLDSAARPGTLVTDVGSVKGSLLEACRRMKLRRIHFVGAHPMAGSHERGIEAARADLYDQGFVFLVRSPGGNGKAFQEVRRFWKKVSPRVVEISAGLHDRIVSEISHLPHAAAVCLVLAAGTSSLRWSSTGFRDTTRTALGHPSLWAPIFLSNSKNLDQSLSNFSRRIGQLRILLKRKNRRALEQLLAHAVKKRSQISL